MPAPARRGRRRSRPLRVTALGGGHGLAASLAALRHVTEDLTAVVTVADDGGSSGRLRQEFGVLPPGDLRMALAALCHDSQWGHLWRDVLQHRFPGDGPLAGHSVGNLLIVALWQLLDDPVDGLRVIGELLGSQGRVLPMSLEPLTIEADVHGTDGDGPALVRGQVQVASTTGRVGWVRLVPEDPPANPEAVQAVLEADWVVLGPGSWFTSVCTHLLVPELAHALETTTARRCVTLNLAPGASETAGYAPEQMLEVLSAYAPGLTLDAVVADPSAVDDVDALGRAAAGFGADLVMRQVSYADGTARHHPLRLAAAYADVFAGVTADLRRA
ncbi:gluconeogenesis factor YvcK family protein [Aquipuribacter sp. SD81]|uniref:gluconeogenesis factor YvcK family protein n=1 Tax=Aquipuribacter sp. SD81 TaxID=3127703 RepID=UPI003016287D